MKNTLIKFVLLGLLFSIVTESYNAFIIEDTTYLLLLTIIPLYTLFFLAIYMAYKKLSLSPRRFCLIVGLIGLIIIENIILGRFVEQWPIQIYMFSYWFSLASYPMILLSVPFKKITKILVKPLIISLVISTAYLLVFENASTTMSLSIVSFYIASAIGNFFYLKKIKIHER